MRLGDKSTDVYFMKKPLPPTLLLLDFRLDGRPWSAEPRLPSDAWSRFGSVSKTLEMFDRRRCFLRTPLGLSGPGPELATLSSLLLRLLVNFLGGRFGACPEDTTEASDITSVVDPLSESRVSLEALLGAEYGSGVVAEADDSLTGKTNGGDMLLFTSCALTVGGLGTGVWPLVGAAWRD